MPASRLGAATASLCALLACGQALANDAPRHLVEADGLISYCEHQGSAPLVVFGGGLEIRASRHVGLRASVLGTAAHEESFAFLEEGAVGPGGSVSARLYPRGSWPRRFGVGAVARLLAFEGLGALFVGAELFYRWILGSRISLKLMGQLGYGRVWDTAPGDGRPGPEHGAIGGAAMGLGLALGWLI